MSKFIIHSRLSIQTINPVRSHVVISVSTPGSKELVFRANSHCRGILPLAFDDLDRRPIQAIPVLLLRQFAKLQQPIPEIVLFDATLADQILDFWQAHPVEEIYLHCDAGISRSPAIAAALQKLSGADDSFWFQTKVPNRLVYRTLLERGQARGLNIGDDGRA